MGLPPLSQFKRFDVRPLFKSGGEPLPEILQRVESLAPAEGLIVIAPFLPSPLIELLGSRGFASKIERGEGSSWMVYFWRQTD
jgi:hypothetical protein